MTVVKSLTSTLPAWLKVPPALMLIASVGAVASADAMCKVPPVWLTVPVTVKVLPARIVPPLCANVPPTVLVPEMDTVPEETVMPAGLAVLLLTSAAMVDAVALVEEKVTTPPALFVRF